MHRGKMKERKVNIGGTNQTRERWLTLGRFSIERERPNQVKKNLRHPSCDPGFETQEHHLRFYRFIFELCHLEKTIINEKEADIGPIFKTMSLFRFQENDILASFFTFWDSLEFPRTWWLHPRWPAWWSSWCPRACPFRPRSRGGCWNPSWWSHPSFGWVKICYD